jgi:hypothetical protein
MSIARFRIDKINYSTRIRGRVFSISNPIIKAILNFFATYLNNIIWALEFELYKIPNLNK